MLLLALQTTTSTTDDSSIDALTLVLVVIFVASMVVLSVILHRGSDRAEAESMVLPPQPEPSRPPATVASVLPSLERQPLPERSRLPAWLDGVTFPTVNAPLVAAAEVVEALLSARRDHDLHRGFQLYTPELLRSLDFDDANLANAEFSGEPPTLRSIEVVSTSGNRMNVRAGYSTGGSEIYRLVRVDDRWMIEEITPGR